ncbi:hypothetical protein [Candidatus Leptofilum sp.]|uniref:hypothetical protein n=1 Tax=Candidatus Leptofilum sp. TaxID=3241576 RepID=UPI003B58E17D
MKQLQTESPSKASPQNHQGRMIILMVITTIIIIIFQVQLANFIYRGEQNFWQSGSDSYGQLARALIEENLFTLNHADPTAHRPPLYPLFLASILTFTDNPQAIIVAQSILSGLTIGLLTGVAYFYTKKSWPTLIIIFLFALSKFIPVDNIVQHETVLFTFLLTVGGILYWAETNAHSNAKIVGLGVVLGLAALARPLAPVLLLFGILWLMWRVLQKNAFSHSLKRVGLFIATALLVLLPWGVRNWISLGTFSLTTTTQGANLWKGNNPATKDMYPELDADELAPLLYQTPTASGWWDPLHRLSTMTEPEQSAYLSNLGLAYIRERPFHFLKMGAVKIWALWTPQNIPTHSGKIEWTEGGARIYDLMPFYDDMTPMFLLYLLVLPGLWKCRKSPFVWYFIMWSLALTAVHAITFAESRFRWPLNMLMLPLAAVGAELIATKIYATIGHFIKKS